MARTRISGVALAPLLLLLLFAFAAEAAEPDPPRYRLLYDAPAECPGRDAFVKGIAGRTPKPRLVDDADAMAIAIDVVIDGTTDSKGRLTLRDPDGTVETRSVASRSCAEVSDALALIAALLLDPDAGTKALPEPPPTAALIITSPPPPPPAPEQEKKKENEEDEPTSVVAAAGVVLGARGGIGPAIAPVAGAFAEVGVPGDRLGFSPSLRLSLAVATTSSDLRGGSHTYEWLAATVHLCPLAAPLPHRLRVSVCGAFEMGAHRGTTSDVPGADSNVGLWLAPGLEGAVAWAWSKRVALELRAGVVFPLRRTRFFLAPDSTVYEVPVVASNLGLGLRIEFL